MAAIGNIALADAQTTPVTQTFNPKRVGDAGGNSSSAEWENRIGGVYDGFQRIKTDVSYPANGRDTIRARIRMMLPVMENVTNSTTSGIAPAPTVAYTPMVDCTFVLPKRSTLQVRKDLRKMFALLLADPQMIALTEQIEVPY